MTTDADIGVKLQHIDQVVFSKLVSDLVYAGAYKEIVDEYSLVEAFGTSVEKERTIASAPFGDVEVRSSGLLIECSVDEEWKDKIKQDLKKYTKRKGEYRKIAFFTNQLAGTKQIKIGGKGAKNIDITEYVKSQTDCEECFLVDRRDLIQVLQQPKFFHIRRKYLAIESDFFVNPTSYLNEIKSNAAFSSVVEAPLLEGYVKELGTHVTFSPGGIYVIYNDEYGALLQTIGVWAEKEFLKNEGEVVIKRDYVFINHPQRYNRNADAEISKNVETFIVIWGANSIENIVDYLMLNKQNTTLIFVCKQGFEDLNVIAPLQASGGTVNPKKISIASIDTRTITEEDVLVHEQKISSYVEDTSKLLKKMEALVYYYSPLDMEDASIKEKMIKALNINETQFLAMKEHLVKSNLAGVTGTILWLQQPGIAKKLFEKMLDDGTFNLLDLYI
jgi:hypothetical protein